MYTTKFLIKKTRKNNILLDPTAPTLGAVFPTSRQKAYISSAPASSILSHFADSVRCASSGMCVSVCVIVCVTLYTLLSPCLSPALSLYGVCVCVCV